MAFPSISHYTQRPTSWLRVGGASGVPGYLPQHYRSRVEIASSTFYVPSGERGSDILQPAGAVPLGYAQDLVVIGYYELDDPGLAGDPFTLDDDDWYMTFDVGFSTDQITLRDGTVWDEDPNLTDTGSWFALESLDVTIPPGFNESATVSGQPVDGTGIQKHSLGATTVHGHRPDSMGGPTTFEWIRAKVRAPTAGISLKTGHSFTIRYFANKYMWERRENPFYAPNNRRRQIQTPDQPGIPSVKSWISVREYSLLNTDIGLRATQVKGGDA